jgi:formylglycine-generating enzyme required for sulfatase activity
MTTKKKQAATSHSIPVEIKLVQIPEGCFKMGSPANEQGRSEDEGPVRRICVNAFQMGKYEITQEQWREVMGTTPAYFKNRASYPVEQVSWNEVQEFISRLNKISKKTYRLPTEAEWEYAARAGTTTVRYWGNDISCNKAMYANSNQIKTWGECMESIRDQGLLSHFTAPVGSYPPNQFGLHDMLGNVAEWCADWYSESYDPNDAQDNPTGPETGSFRVQRGGSWANTPSSIRAASRSFLRPDDKFFMTGFRLVVSSPKKKNI